jgi:hypothetical protein
MEKPPVTPHPSEADLDRFRRRTLSAGELVAFSDHFERCEACRHRVADSAAGQTIDLLDRVVGRSTHHVSEDNIHGYVNHTLDAQQRHDVESHLQHCRSCADEIRDLQSFADSDRRPDRRSWEPRTWWYPRLSAGDALAAAAPPTRLFRSAPVPILMTLNDGSNTVRVDAHGNVSPAYALDPADTATVRQTLVQGQLAVPANVLRLRGTDSGRLRGPAADSPFQALAPIGTAVQSDRPTLRWTALAPNATYIVRLRDETNGTTITSAALHTTEWTPDRRLLRGDTFVWQVEGSDHGHESIAPEPPAPAARFVVLSTADAQRLDHAPASHLVRGILYANAGALDDAEHEFAELRAQNPGSALAQQLSDQVAEARRAQRRN